MLTPPSVFADYGLGAQRFTAVQRELWGHGGGIPGFTSMTVYSPTEDASISVLVNQTDGAPQEILEALLGALVAAGAQN